MTYPTLTRYNVNDVVKCIKPVVFIDGHKHIKGQNLTVTKSTVDYFNYSANQDCYVIWHRGA
jgi:hypothetical protein